MVKKLKFLQPQKCGSSENSLTENGLVKQLASASKFNYH